VGWDSIVGIVTRYKLDSPGIEAQWGAGETFHIHPDLHWGPPSFLYYGYWVLARGGKAARAWH